MILSLFKNLLNVKKNKTEFVAVLVKPNKEILNDFNLFMQGYDATDGFLKSEKFRLFLNVVAKDEESQNDTTSPIASTSQI